MAKQTCEEREIRSALFIDFDNIYIGLNEEDKDVASQFATNPGRWLAWLESQALAKVADDTACTRKILVRRCYLNPQSFQKWRPYFIRSAFEVVDCPPLTSHGKTSADIHMVMDILDALDHPTHFDEFIIFSGDADFTPVLMRLRQHDRRSVVLAVGYTSPAYNAACDYLIDRDGFIEKALSTPEKPVTTGRRSTRGKMSNNVAPVLKKMADKLYDEASVTDAIQASDLLAIYKGFPDFTKRNDWLGLNSLRTLTEAIISQRDDLVILEEDPWKVAVPDEVAEEVASRLNETAAVEAAGDEALRAEVRAYIRDAVRRAGAPVPMAALAQEVYQRFGDRIGNTRWLGAGTFKNLLLRLKIAEIEVSPVTPGFVYDPARHTPPRESQRVDKFAEQYPDLARLAWKVHHLTDTPYLMPEHYAILLRELAKEVNANGYHLIQTSKVVRDRCNGKGAPIARSHVNFAMRGITFSGHRFAEGEEKAEVLGQALVDNTINLCHIAQLELSDEERALVREWITGKIE